ncbi:MAG: zinc ribbon domain-containing protein [Bacteroidales bacterium]|nr:zinc ribbon domain-containing protein [Bacteroidales bacterium]
MALPKQLTDVIDQVVRKDELTMQNRKLIMKIALSMGVGTYEVSQYIEEAERKKSHTVVVGQKPDDEPAIDLTALLPPSKKKAGGNIEPPPYQPKPESDGYTIPAKIKQLTALALKDRVMTPVERQTIIDEAVKKGVFADVINKYLDDALDERLKSYTKEELGNCPGCGHGVPVFADQCPYCGRTLEHQERGIISNRPLTISGNAAKIISQENIKTEQQRVNITNCPKCGAKYPLISHVCTHCGYVLHEQAESEHSAKTLLEAIKGSIAKLKGCPNPTFGQILWFNVNILLFVLSIVLLWMIAVTPSHSMSEGLCAMFGFLFLFLSFLLSVKKLKRVSPVTTADNMFCDALGRHAMYSRQAKTLYGNDKDAIELLENYQAIINSTENNRKEIRKKRFVSIAIFLIAPLLIPLVYYLVNLDTKTEFRRNYDEHPQLIEVADIAKTLKPYPPSTGVKRGIEVFFTATNEVDLTFDVVNFNTEGDSIRFVPRINQMELNSGGKKLQDAALDTLSVVLLDKDLKPTKVKFRLTDSSMISGAKRIIANGAGHCYVDFVDIDHFDRPATELKDFADGFVYYMLQNGGN